MENYIVSKRTDEFYTIQTNDNKRVVMLKECIAHFNAISPADTKSSLPINGAPLKTVIRLLEDFQSNVDINLQLAQVAVSELATFLKVVDILECEVLFLPILSALSDNLCKVNNKKVFKELETILPEHLQKTIEKKLLLDHGLIKHFIKTTPLVDASFSAPDKKLSVSLEGAGDYLVLSSGLFFDLYALKQDAQKIGSYPGGFHALSPDGKYLVRQSDHTTTTGQQSFKLIALETNKELKETFESFDCRFNDSLFITDDATYELKADTINKVITVPEKDRTFLCGLRRFVRQNGQLKFLHFDHPAFSALKNQEEIDTLCLQLPESVKQGEPTMVSISSDLHYVTIWYEDTLFVYDISDIKSISLMLRKEGVHSVEYAGAVVWWTSQHQLCRYNCGDGSYKEFDIQADKVFFSTSPDTFVRVDSTSHKITLCHFDETAQTLFYGDIPHEYKAGAYHFKQLFITADDYSSAALNGVQYFSDNSCLVTRGWINNKQVIEMRTLPLEHILRDFALSEFLACIAQKGSQEQDKFVSKKSRSSARKNQVDDEQRFTCSLCDYKAMHLSAVTRHMTVHRDTKPFACSKCTFAAKHYSNLLQHLAVHETKKPFKCDVCAYETKHVSSLTRHKKVHESEKPFECNLCTYKTTQSTNFRRHVATKHT